ncbi:MAG: AraC family transcriptional regulator [Victivallaceae bacterium]|nr:AraC family transcriptional regulator [Victivallaceae bacterium]
MSQSPYIVDRILFRNNGRDHHIHDVIAWRYNGMPEAIDGRSGRYLRDFFQISMLHCGEMDVFCNGAEATMRPGDVFLVHPDDWLGQNQRSTTLQIYHILFKREVIEPMLGLLEEPSELFSIFRDKHIPDPTSERFFLFQSTREIRRLVHALHQEMLHPGNNSGLFRRACLYELITRIDRCRQLRAAKERWNSLADFIAAEIEAHFREPFDYRGAADRWGSSQNHLCTQLRKRTGSTISEKLRKRRIQEAQRLLVETDLPVSETAQRSGFCDLSYFYRSFQELAGCSPREYREKNLSLTR